METTQAVTSAVMTSPSFVIVPRADALPKLVYGLVILGLGIAFFVALMVFLSAVLPRLREKAQLNLRTHPWQTFALGLTGYAVLGSLAAFIYSHSYVEYLLRTEFVPSMLAAVIAICALVIVVTILGGTGLVRALGEKLEQLNGQAMSGLRKTVWGSLTLVGASLFPAIGWFVILPISLPLAFGAALRVMLPGRIGGAVDSGESSA